MPIIRTDATLRIGTQIAEKEFGRLINMTKTSWIVIGVFTLIGAVAARRRAETVGERAKREVRRCEGLLARLDARCANFR